MFPQKGMQRRESRGCENVCQRIFDCPLEINTGLFSVPWEESPWKFTSLVWRTKPSTSGNQPERLPHCLFPFFRDHSGFLQKGVSGRSALPIASFILLLASKLTVFQPLPWEIYTGFTLQVMWGPSKKVKWAIWWEWALESCKLVVGKCWFLLSFYVWISWKVWFCWLNF